MRVLIAEDDAVSRLILKRAVERLGHECRAAADGLEAWEFYRQAPGEVEVIISDWMMPGLDGPGLCEKVRAHAADGEPGYPFFVFLTALGDREHLLQGMRAGADDFLKKPLDREELEARLIAAERVTKLHRRLHEQRQELEQLNRRFSEEARRDPLTGLGNRLRLEEDLEALQGQVQRYGHSYCAILCDIDHFKAYNDAHGHLAGDDALRRIADVISENFRLGDVAYRYGGEEFLIILAEQTLPSATVAAERLRRKVEDLAIPNDGVGGALTLSCGVAVLSPRGEKSVKGLLQEADAALYDAKRRGRNLVASYGGGASGRGPEEPDARETPGE